MSTSALGTDLCRLKTELVELFPVTKQSDRFQVKRGMANIAARLIGCPAAGIGLGSSCFLKSISVGCDKISKETREATNSAIAHMNDMQTAWSRVQNVTKMASIQA